jgi:hypothetical protein
VHANVLFSDPASLTETVALQFRICSHPAATYRKLLHHYQCCSPPHTAERSPPRTCKAASFCALAHNRSIMHCLCCAHTACSAVHKVHCLWLLCLLHVAAAALGPTQSTSCKALTITGAGCFERHAAAGCQHPTNVASKCRGALPEANAACNCLAGVTAVEQAVGV